MNYETLIALITFAFISSITPGPNNLMLLSSGTNFGFKRTIPHMLGITTGVICMIILVGLGLMKVFIAYPLVQSTLKVVSVTYLLYLSYKIGTSSRPSNDIKSSATPMSALQALLFQWVNPKAWTMALTAITLYTTTMEKSEVFYIAVVFGLINLPCICVWTVLGQKLSRFLTDPKKLKVFNIFMAVLLTGSLYFLI